MINLKPGEVICDKCKGTGKLKVDKTFMYENDHITAFNEIACTKCRGKCKLDWLENVVGKKNTPGWGSATLKYKE